MKTIAAFDLHKFIQIIHHGHFHFPNRAFHNPLSSVSTAVRTPSVTDPSAWSVSGQPAVRLAPTPAPAPTPPPQRTHASPRMRGRRAQIGFVELASGPGADRSSDWRKRGRNGWQIVPADRREEGSRYPGEGRGSSGDGARGHCRRNPPRSSALPDRQPATAAHRPFSALGRTSGSLVPASSVSDSRSAWPVGWHGWPSPSGSRRQTVTAVRVRRAAERSRSRAGDRATLRDPPEQVMAPTGHRDQTSELVAEGGTTTTVYGPTPNPLRLASSQARRGEETSNHPTDSPPHPFSALPTNTTCGAPGESTVGRGTRVYGRPQGYAEVVTSSG